MKKLILAAFAISAVLPHISTNAQTMRGVSSCGVWAKERRDKTENYERAWLVGFLSGMSAATGVEFWRKDGNRLDTESVSLWMDKFCRENPLENLSEGAVDLYIEHTRK